MEGFLEEVIKPDRSMMYRESTNKLDMLSPGGARASCVSVLMVLTLTPGCQNGDGGGEGQPLHHTCHAVKGT